MKIYLPDNVYTSALERLHRVFDEFETIVLNFSGGKDSTVVLNLALKVAEERGRLPLPVYFLDQEAEWDTVITYIRQVMSDPRIKPYWLQVPFKIFNATSPYDPWLYCWKEGAEWIRPKEPNSIHENVFGTDRFGEMFGAFGRWFSPDKPMCHIAGVRAEESPARLNGLTSYETYKGITWGRAENKQIGHYSFYPLYDWSYTDVWKAIHSNGWPYCKLYDYMYQYGVPVKDMRVSNVHHETAILSLTFLQDIEPVTWDKIISRVQGVNAVSKSLGLYRCPSELPSMFSDWRQYRDHLLENLITEPANRDRMREQFAGNDDNYADPKVLEQLYKTEISAILVNDWHGTKLTMFHATHGKYSKNRGKLNGHLAATKTLKSSY